MPDKPLTLGDLAQLAGVKHSTMKKYHQRATQRRKEIAEGTATEMAEWMLPEPDLVAGKTPLWYPATAQAWLDHRPRAGVGVGTA